jgi:beta-lactam-binding protein with PASTA domain
MSKKKGMKKVWLWLWRNPLLRSVVYAAVGFALLILAIHFTLRIATLHGESFPVPDFTGLSREQAEATGREHRLRVEIVDSVYVPQRPRGTVYSQLPEPYARVKRNRRVLLTINALQPRKVTVPDVVGYSLRQAKNVLQSQGLAVGRLLYVSDMATNNVREQYYRNVPVEKNTQIDAGSEIDLLLGLNAADPYTVIPRTIGLSAESAKELLLDYSLNVVAHYDRSVGNYPDSLAARVYRQVPETSLRMIWPRGTRVNIYLRTEPDARGAEAADNQ